MNTHKKAMEKTKNYDYYTIGADIGGTNTKLGIFGIINEKPGLLGYFHYASPMMNDISDAINDVLRFSRLHYNKRAERACLAVAGPVSAKRDYAMLTNAGWDISTSHIKKRTGLKSLFLINDFEAVGFGINVLEKKDLCTVNRGKPVVNGTLALIGAGTGLGKAVMIYDRHINAYIPVGSEGGHSDFPATNDFELELVNFVRHFRKIKRNISIENILSGSGIENIYYFLRSSGRKSAYNEVIDKSKSKPELISKYRNKCSICSETFTLFAKFCAGAARNFALESLSRGGVYIGGGIAMKNPDMFDKNFVREFTNNERLKRLLSSIPVKAIKNYYTGLLGAGFASMKSMDNMRFCI